jgi:hypothetical protein
LLHQAIEAFTQIDTPGGPVPKRRDHLSQAALGGGRIEPGKQLHQAVRARLRRQCATLLFGHGVNADACVAPHHAQASLPVQRFQRQRRGRRRRAPAVDHGALADGAFQLARMRFAILAHETKHLAAQMAMPAQKFEPSGRQAARMQQRKIGIRQEAVNMQHAFGNGQGGILSFQIAGAVACDAVTQDQILGARRRTDRVSLHKTERANRVMQPGRLEQRSRNGIVTQRR